jgi:hypothetical protein
MVAVHAHVESRAFLYCRQALIIVNTLICRDRTPGLRESVKGRAGQCGQGKTKGSVKPSLWPASFASRRGQPQANESADSRREGQADSVGMREWQTREVKEWQRIGTVNRRRRMEWIQWRERQVGKAVQFEVRLCSRRNRKPNTIKMLWAMSKRRGCGPQRPAHIINPPRAGFFDAVDSSVDGFSEFSGGKPPNRLCRFGDQSG